MRKTIVRSLLIIIVCCLSSCAKSPSVTQSDFPATTEINAVNDAASTKNAIEVATSTKTAETLPVYTPGLVKLDPEEDYCDDGDGASFKRNFRLVYYRIPSPIDDFAGQEGYDFLEEIINASSGELSEMFLVSYVKRFNIPKETFENMVKEIEDIQLSIGLDLTEEEYELPNADIIYTFDNEIINEYYRRR